MRIVFLVLILIHGLIHLLGFAKGFGLKEVKELTLPISKTMGLIWLIATLLFFIFCVLYFINHKYSWLIGFAAVITSQVLIILFWQDAKYGTLPNIAVLLVSLVAFGNYNFQKLIQLETSNILSQNIISSKRIVSKDDTKDLPKPVQNWLQQSGIIGKPFICVGQVLQEAQIKLKPEQENWLNATALQYSTIPEPAFIWTVDVKMNSLMSFLGRDKFEDGAGEMLIKLNALFNIVNEKGLKLDEGSIQRYLGEMVWFPSLAMSQYITWQEINETTAIATMDYKGTKGSGTFYFDSAGNFIKFSALRFQGNDPEAQRYEWVLLVEEHSTFEGITIPSKMTATWKLENEDWTWLKLEIKDIKYNENIRH
mgnify:CR=1 FL=1|tara:strand:- start:242 stop:1342 length:1101 start_codon:yes stop_codon:yes gene_type:complete